MARDGNQSTDGIGGALDVLGRHRRALYGFTLLVSLLTVVLGCAILAGGFAAAWDAFENVRDYADRNIANEDSYVAYADGGLPPLVRVGAVVSVLLLVLDSSSSPSCTPPTPSPTRMPRATADR
ncbi:hypothetical protein SPURM210S_08353 [Streptomyces purpurascens]